MDDNTNREFTTPQEESTETTTNTPSDKTQDGAPSNEENIQRNTGPLQNNIASSSVLNFSTNMRY